MTAYSRIVKASHVVNLSNSRRRQYLTLVVTVRETSNCGLVAGVGVTAVLGPTRISGKNSGYLSISLPTSK